MNIKFKYNQYDAFSNEPNEIFAYVRNMNIKLPYYPILLFTLIERGYMNENGDIDINGKSSLGSINILKYVISNDYLDILMYLLDNKIDINTQAKRGINEDEEGRTLLMYAVIYNVSDILEYLIKNNANVNIQNNKGWTALMYAVDDGRSNIVEYLIENCKNINLNIKNTTDGKTALMLAIKNGNLEIIKYLVENKINRANLNVKDVYDRTALDIAIQYKDKEIIKYLKDEINKKKRIK